MTDSIKQNLDCVNIMLEIERLKNSVKKLKIMTVYNSNNQQEDSESSEISERRDDHNKSRIKNYRSREVNQNHSPRHPPHMHKRENTKYNTIQSESSRAGQFISQKFNPSKSIKPKQFKHISLFNM